MPKKTLFLMGSALLFLCSLILWIITYEAKIFGIGFLIFLTSIVYHVYTDHRGTINISDAFKYMHSRFEDFYAEKKYFRAVTYASAIPMVIVGVFFILAMLFSLFIQ